MRLPLKIKRHDESFIVTDASGVTLLAVYFDAGEDTSRRAIRNRMGLDEAQDIARRCARFLTDEQAKNGAGT